MERWYLGDDVGLNQDTNGRRRITVISLFGRDFYGFSAVAPTSDRSSSTLANGRNTLYIRITYLCFTYVYMPFCLCYINVANLLTGITFIYTVCFVGDRWDEGEVERT